MLGGWVGTSFPPRVGFSIRLTGGVIMGSRTQKRQRRLQLPGGGEPGIHPRPAPTRPGARRLPYSYDSILQLSSHNLSELAESFDYSDSGQEH